jgi:preprotein translocase subunit SecY
MASAAEQMAANISWSTLGKATELRQRIFFTVGLLIVYRIGTYIPVPGIDAIALQQFMDQAASGIGGVLSMFTGGALARMGIFALGIMPYISASIIVQLLGAMWEPLKQLKKEGELGRKKNQPVYALWYGVAGYISGLWFGCKPASWRLGI